MIQAILFDMDGTLIDTEKYYRIFWPKALAAFGFEMSDAQALRMRSLGNPFGNEQLRAWYGADLDCQAVREKRRELMEPYVEREGIQCKTGAVELLSELKKRGMTTAIATATNMAQTEKYLEMTGLAGYFDRIISAHMVKEGKPSPDVYLYACEQLGVKPENCMAVEDSPNGVLSAYRAGCKTVMVPDQTEPDEELRRCLFAEVGSLSEIMGLLSREQETDS